MKRLALAVTVGIGLAYWGISIGRSLGEPAPAVVTVHQAATEDIRGTPKPKIDRAPDAVAAPVSPRERFAFQADLENYAFLKSIVLPSEEQKRERQEVLRNAKLIRAIGARLVKLPLLDPEEQDLAMDILLDAIKDGDRMAAEEVVRAVIEDAQVENESMPKNVREGLAGLKAELLYKYTAIDPGARFTLPGPVSNKIWDNVQALQASNEAISADLRSSN